VRIIITAIDAVYNWARSNSLWPVTFATSCCGIEMISTSAASFDIARFGSEVFNGYGAAEAMYAAIECREHDGLHIDSSRFLIEVVDENGKWTDEEGDILITSLTNHTMPFIRYRIGDRGILSYESCSCGIHMPKLKRILGRSVDHIKAPSGRIIDFAYLATVFDKRHDSIDTFKLVLERADCLKVMIVARDKGRTEEVKEAADAIKKYVGEGMEVKLEIAESIPLGRTGKRMFIESRI